LFAEHLREEVVHPVPHRHVTFTIPRALRGLFERDRSLLSLPARCAYEALRRMYPPCRPDIPALVDPMP
jgi:hypothetical protein